tara:strand:- start:6129 stop:6395 length:267 start_codon:yes stop_codon:yes gene_type:complete
MNLKNLIKLGFGKIEAVKSAKSAGVAGTGGILFAVFQDLLPGPLADPIIGIPMITWVFNTVRKLVINNDPISARRQRVATDTADIADE